MQDNDPEPAQDNPWPSLSAQIFDDKPVGDGTDILAIEAPYRARNAAFVPLAINTLTGGRRGIDTITLVIDQNPSPLAATFKLGKNSGIRNISTHVRVDSYTNIHAVAAMAAGPLLATKRFVKASGGCSAPAATRETSSIPLGAMHFVQFPPIGTSSRRQAQLTIRHPNHSGMQMDQVTRLYVPAHFVTNIRIWQGDNLLLSIESGISISENPEFRFDYLPNGAADFRAEVKDNEGKIFTDRWSATRA